jgi:hypothetical protein
MFEREGFLSLADGRTTASTFIRTLEPLFTVIRAEVRKHHPELCLCYIKTGSVYYCDAASAMPRHAAVGHLTGFSDRI